MAPLAHTLALLAMAVATAAIEEVTLDMAPNSFDDQYQGCGRAMAAELPALNHSDFQKKDLFNKVWAKAVDEWWSKGRPMSPLVSPVHPIAIMVYTMNYLYKEFNAATRVAGSSPRQYRDNFPFKTLHFLLTHALGLLRDAEGPKCRCVTRGVKGVQFKAQPGRRVRFGQFASTSLCENATHFFGTDTVFKVETCHGVDIQKFSYFKKEQEVLVPPFETFEVTNVTREGEQQRIHLKSTGTFSNYSCEWLKGDTVGTTWEDQGHSGGSPPRNSPHLGGLLLATVAVAVVTGTL